VRKKGFTLIELLVVISIIALLLSILMPSLSKVKAQAKIVVCSTRIRQNLLGATMAANDNNGKLPRGGFNFDDPTTNIEHDFDDAISFRAEEYLNLCSYITGEGSSMDTNKSASTDEIRTAAELVINSKAKDNFVCPSIPPKEEDCLAAGGNIFPTVTKSPLPFIHAWGGAGWTARIGYSYLAGFDSDKWDWSTVNLTDSKRWKSPMRTTDRGSLVVMADRSRYNPGFGVLILSHGLSSNGWVIVSNNYEEVMQEYGGCKANVGCLDGSVGSDRIKNLRLGQMTMSNGVVPGYQGDDYVFF
jgi:prepilin-type N-terminal cleavage/methylation domain-containing protein